ncbi:uncharacterized protein [Drosophila tropicalis]|uniref:uncharacterized protein n=1 Tax=Drosophila tropicalis TaxID=46794 RepID=UPI0035AC23E6
MSSCSAVQLAVAHHQEQANVGNLLGRRYAKLLHAEKYTDCVFHVTDEEIKCHKLILCASSPVFEAMFYGPLQDHGQDNQIEIDDISAEIFKVLIEYIYTGSVDWNGLELLACIELYYAAEKYLMDQLIADSLVAITRKLRFSNILPALELSVCMGLDGLLEVCMTFFMRCCVNNSQYMSYLKEHYVHVAKECVKSIIAACKEPYKLLIWYVYEWTQRECEQLGLAAADMDDLGGATKCWPENSSNPTVTAATPSPIILVERCYYKACRPFTVEAESPVWRLRLKCSRFISLMGLVLNSRLTPNPPGNLSHVQIQLPLEYRENLRLDLCELPAEGEEGPVTRPVWSHTIKNQITKYNCDLNLNWSREEACILTPDLLYEIQLRWDGAAYGAEYPCSLQSCQSNDQTIRFIDGSDGSLVKGLRYANLV